MALLLEVLQKSEKTYAIGRGFYGFCFYISFDTKLKLPPVFFLGGLRLAVGGLGYYFIDDIVPFVMIFYHLIYSTPVGKATQVTIVDEHIDLEFTREMWVIVSGFLGIVAVYGIELESSLATILYGFIEELSLADGPEYQAVAILTKHLQGVDGEGDFLAYLRIFMGNYCTVEFY